MLTRTNAVRPVTDVAVVVAVSLPEPLVALRDRSLIEERARVFILLKKTMKENTIQRLSSQLFQSSQSRCAATTLEGAVSHHGQTSMSMLRYSKG